MTAASHKLDSTTGEIRTGIITATNIVVGTALSTSSNQTDLALHHLEQRLTLKDPLSLRLIQNLFKRLIFLVVTSILIWLTHNPLL